MCCISICTYIITLDWPNGSQNTCKMGCLYPGKTSALHKHDVLSSTRLSSTCQLQLDVITRLFSLRGISLPPEGELSNCTSLLWYLSLVTQFPMKIKIRWERSPLLSPLICLYYDICLCSKIIFAKNTFLSVFFWCFVSRFLFLPDNVIYLIPLIFVAFWINL